MQGEHANRIWNLIYSQSCFTNITDKCTERRIFHRLISGALVPLPHCIWRLFIYFTISLFVGTERVMRHAIDCDSVFCTDTRVASQGTCLSGELAAILC